MSKDDEKPDFDDHFEPFPRELYEAEPGRNVGGVEKPLSEPYQESPSGKSLSEKCRDDLREYRSKLAGWRRRRKQTRDMFDKGPKRRRVLLKISRKIRFYETLIQKTKQQRDE